MERVISIIAKYLDIQVEDIKPEFELRNLTTDSLDWIEIIMVLEDEFNVSISDEDINSLRTIQDIAEFIEENITPNEAGVER